MGERQRDAEREIERGSGPDWSECWRFTITTVGWLPLTLVCGQVTVV